MEAVLLLVCSHSVCTRFVSIVIDMSLQTTVAVCWL